MGSLGAGSPRVEVMGQSWGREEADAWGPQGLGGRGRAHGVGETAARVHWRVIMFCSLPPAGRTQAGGGGCRIHVGLGHGDTCRAEEHTWGWGGAWCA